jgi:hypothetical protein
MEKEKDRGVSPPHQSKSSRQPGFGTASGLRMFLGISWDYGSFFFDDRPV